MNNELYHYGVPGMKWGVRKSYIAPNKSAGSSRGWGQRRKSDSERRYEDSRGINPHRPNGTKNSIGVGSAVRKAKRKAEIKRNVDAYDKKYNAAERTQEKADFMFEEVQENRKALGKTGITRTARAIFSKSDSAKKYRKSYDRLEKQADLADKLYEEAKKLYKKTGKNRISRIINNVKYGS